MKIIECPRCHGEGRCPEGAPNALELAWRDFAGIALADRPGAFLFWLMLIFGHTLMGVVVGDLTRPTVGLIVGTYWIPLMGILSLLAWIVSIRRLVEPKETP